MGFKVKSPDLTRVVIVVIPWRVRTGTPTGLLCETLADGCQGEDVLSCPSGPLVASAGPPRGVEGPRHPWVVSNP